MRPRLDFVMTSVFAVLITALAAPAAAQGVDFGDAPDGPYPTLLASNGARHGVSQALFLGAGVDSELNGQPNANATGDDIFDGNDDEDGVILRAAISPGALVPVDITASAPGILNAWLDFNGSGTWADPGEQIFIDTPLVAGVNNLNFQVPAAPVLGFTYARFRLSSLPGLGFTGPSIDGEVEDYEVFVTNELGLMDFGDAPDPPFPTLFVSNGARHWIAPGVQLGIPVDPEWDGQPLPVFRPADGDDMDGSDDEDGVMILTPIDATVNPTQMRVGASAMGFLNVWIDWGADGSWLTPGDQVIFDQLMLPGINVVNFPPTPIVLGATFMRVRYCLNPGNCNLPFGIALDGEVEDYEVWITNGQATLFDWADAPDPPYPTLAMSGGANHPPFGIGMFLGNVVDGDQNGQLDLFGTALGDDLMDASDDDDGITFRSMLAPGSPANVDVWVTDPTGTALLDAWIDYNGNGSWLDAGDQILFSIPVVNGLNRITIPISAAAAVGTTTYARFRVDPGGGLTPFGPANDGEVEDEQITFTDGMDYGDAPDPTYPTLSLSNGAGHIIVPGYYLGVGVDADPDGQPTALADGDDFDGNDDEDGVTFTTPVSPGNPAAVAVTASAPGLLNAWIDYNADGDWNDAGEQIFSNWALPAGSTGLAFNVPASATPGPTFARFRFDSAGGLPPWGVAFDGEVEDELITIVSSPLMDYGDASDPTYPTLFASNGARHFVVAGFFLGAAVDPEFDGQPNANATGDDTDGNDDEDGVLFTTALRTGDVAGVDVIASVAGGGLYAWIDFNADGDWADAGEQIFNNLALAAGTNSLSFPVPAGATVGTTFSRFRLSTSGGLLYDGASLDGEVEDHEVTVEQGYDFGDAPDPSYPTLLASNAARHAVAAGVSMGAGWDVDVDGQPDATCTGDDTDGNDDEDGVVFTSPPYPGSTGDVDVTVSTSGLLNAWMDLNDDGDWSDAGEQIFTDQAVTAGTNSLSYSVPTGPDLLTVIARFRFSTGGGLGTTGSAGDGEVEDYELTGSLIFADDLESGDTSAWSRSVP